MRKYKLQPFGNIEVDLDDPKTYDLLPKTTEELRSLMFENIGYAYCYMNYYHKDSYIKYPDQKNTIEQMIEYFTNNEKQNRDNVLWYQEQVFLFEDEIENMC